MVSFPFTQSEWQRVQDASTPLVNATLADDNVLHASLLEELLVVLGELRERYGEHPILLETEADFCDDPVLQRDIYRRAIELAEPNGLPTFTIRMSIASLLLEHFNDPKQAETALAACKAEVLQHADRYEKREWMELMRRCRPDD
jgi:hypothetical protein